METKTGIIKSIAIQEGVGAKGPYCMYVYNMEDGKKYSTFDENIQKAGFKAGDSVSIEGQQNGKYWNMSSMTKIAAIEPQSNNNGFNGEKVIASILREILAELKIISFNQANIIK